jgi:hypothetical protein
VVVEIGLGLYQTTPLEGRQSVYTGTKEISEDALTGSSLKEMGELASRHSELANTDMVRVH